MRGSLPQRIAASSLAVQHGTNDQYGSSAFASANREDAQVRVGLRADLSSAGSKASFVTSNGRIGLEAPPLQRVSSRVVWPCRRTGRSALPRVRQEPILQTAAHHTKGSDARLAALRLRVCSFSLAYRCFSTMRCINLSNSSALRSREKDRYHSNIMLRSAIA